MTLVAMAGPGSRLYVSAAGDLADLDIVTITGSGFGTNVAAANQDFTGYSDGPVEALANGVSWSANLPANWTQAGGTDQLISTDASLNGTRSIVSRDLNDVTHYQFGCRRDLGAQKRITFTRFHVLTVDPDNDLIQTKLIRHLGGPTADGISDADTPNMYIGRSYNGGIGSYIARNTAGGVGTPIDPTVTGDVTGHITDKYTSIGGGTWFTIELMCIADSAQGAGDGSISWSSRNETTGAIVASGSVGSSVLWGASATYLPWEHITMQGYMQVPDGTGDSLAQLYFDRDFYSAWADSGTTPPKYPLLGDASTYSACTILTSCTWGNGGGTWSDTSIGGVKVNQGQHGNLTGKFWYVMSAPNTPINSSGIAA
jgi:hypothetical protein